MSKSAYRPLKGQSLSDWLDSLHEWCLEGAPDRKENALCLELDFMQVGTAIRLLEAENKVLLEMTGIADEA